METSTAEYVKKNHDEKVVRKLSDMPQCFLDQAAVKDSLNKDPVLYTVYAKHDKLGMSMAVTVMEPVRIGREFSMTKGHVHARESPELYMLHSGRIMLLMQKGNDFRKIDMMRGEVYYVPPGWAHRIVNTARTRSECFVVYPTEAGHDYGAVKDGFKERVLSRYVVGIDLGGTTINTILMEQDGTAIRKVSMDTESVKGRDTVIQNMVSSVREVVGEIPNEDIIGIGVGIPGLSDEKGVVINTPNIPSLNGLHLKESLKSELKLPVRIGNDVTCVALGENMFGAGKGFRNLVCLTLGTGVGGGIIIEGKPYYGLGRSGEVGHITVHPDGRKCGCDNTGCLEECISVRAIMRLVKEKGLSAKSPRELAELAKNGDRTAMEIYENVGKHLGIGLSDIVKVLDPDVILLGGGISDARDIITKPAMEEMRKRTFFDPPEIRFMELGKWAGAIGAASLFLEN